MVCNSYLLLHFLNNFCRFILYLLCFRIVSWSVVRYAYSVMALRCVAFRVVRWTARWPPGSRAAANGSTWHRGVSLARAPLSRHRPKSRILGPNVASGSGNTHSYSNRPTFPREPRAHSSAPPRGIGTETPIPPARCRWHVPLAQGDH